MLRRNRLCALEFRCAEIAYADMPDLALRDKVVECAKCFVKWRQGIAIVELEQLNVISTEPFQTRFDRADDMRAPKTHLVETSASAQANLGSDEHARLVKTKIGKHLSDHFL